MSQVLSFQALLISVLQNPLAQLLDESTQRITRSVKLIKTSLAVCIGCGKLHFKRLYLLRCFCGRIIQLFKSRLPSTKDSGTPVSLAAFTKCVMFWIQSFSF